MTTNDINDGAHEVPLAVVPLAIAVILAWVCAWITSWPHHRADWIADMGFITAMGLVLIAALIWAES